MIDKYKIRMRDETKEEFKLYYFIPFPQIP